MKKHILIGLLATGLSFQLQAQGLDTDKRIRFGAYIAPNMSWMRPTANKDDKGEFAPTNEGMRLGYTWGLIMDYHITENYVINTGVQLNTTGGKINTSKIDQTPTASTVSQANFEYKLQYLEIPVALKLKTDEIEGFKFFGQLGVTLGFNFQKLATYKVNYWDENGQAMVVEGEKEKLKGNLATSPILFQMNIGAGAEYPLSSKLTAYLGIFFNNGFAPDATNPEKYNLPYQGSFRDGNTRLNNFALRLGLYF